MFIYRALRKIVGPNKDEVTMDGRKLHNAQIKMNEISKACGKYGGEEEVHTAFW
jgi:hypothetical protein